MGLFDKKDKKRKDDFDSPVDQVDLGSSSRATPEPVAAKPAPAPTPEPAKPAPAPAASTSEPVAAPAAASTPKAATPASAPAKGAASMDNDDYGIDKAIELMRTLPSENIELVVQVVKFSLESVGIHLPTIIQDATRRQNDLQGRIAALKAEIADLEAEIKQRREEIAKHEGDHKETTMVRDRLELAEKIGKKPAAAVVSSSSSTTASGGDSASASSSGSGPMSSGGSLPTLGGTHHRERPVTGQTAVIPPKK